MKVADLSDDEWLDSLQKDPVYADLDVRQLYGKMIRWCEVNDKEPTRRRFVNWLNHQERPMSARPGRTDAKTNRLKNEHDRFIERHGGHDR